MILWFFGGCLFFLLFFWFYKLYGRRACPHSELYHTLMATKIFVPIFPSLFSDFLKHVSISLFHWSRPLSFFSQFITLSSSLPSFRQVLRSDLQFNFHTSSSCFSKCSRLHRLFNPVFFEIQSVRFSFGQIIHRSCCFILKRDSKRLLVTCWYT